MLVEKVLKDNGLGDNGYVPFDLTITPFDTQLKIQAGAISETFTPLVPSSLESDGISLKLMNGTKGFGSIAKGDLRTLLNIENTNNTSDADKPLSIAATTALNNKHDKITATNKLAIPLVDGLDAAIALMATKADLQAATANQSLGIKYEWASPAAQTAQTGMIEGEQGVLVGAAGARDVYTYKGGVWSKTYTLSASHNHDDRYYQKTESDAALLLKQNKTDSLPMAQVTGLATAIDALATKAMVQTNVPPSAVFTDKNWDGADKANQRLQNLENAISASTEFTGVVFPGNVSGNTGTGSLRNAVPLDDLLSMIIDPQLDSFYLISNGPQIDSATGKPAEFKIRSYMTSRWEDPRHNTTLSTGRKCDLKANGVDHGGICGFLYSQGEWKDPRDMMAWHAQIVLQVQMNGRIHYRRYEVDGTVIRLGSGKANPDRMLIHSVTHKTSFDLNGNQ
ncbi:gp35 virion protein [Iodobacter phage PhiPLPE]|uniref:Gp35 virion protein n=1 Tax=Iodobacter phage PhiPLPE TaxID=551895 RepID=B5AX54_9CAUD|nr:gp35 virion protein [Iodobacter phage PhiPLPE]ACG60357.1 gp35 virion protein [Iodobacter phage PhiPLPE]